MRPLAEIPTLGCMSTLLPTKAPQRDKSHRAITNAPARLKGQAKPRLAVTSTADPSAVPPDQPATPPPPPFLSRLRQFEATYAIDVQQDMEPEQIPTKPVPTDKPGRPSGYDPRINSHLWECFAQGMTKNEVCLTVGLNPMTMHRWEQKYPSFCYAIKVGEALSQGWWDRKGRENIDNPDFNNTLYMMCRVNMHKWQRSAADGATTINNDNRTQIGNAQFNTAVSSLKGLSDADLEALAAINSRLAPAAQPAGG